MTAHHVLAGKADSTARRAAAPGNSMADLAASTGLPVEVQVVAVAGDSMTERAGLAGRGILAVLTVYLSGVVVAVSAGEPGASTDPGTRVLVALVVWVAPAARLWVSTVTRVTVRVGLMAFRAIVMGTAVAWEAFFLVRRAATT
jgi:hypothetical protein